MGQVSERMIYLENRINGNCVMDLEVELRKSEDEK